MIQKCYDYSIILGKDENNLMQPIKQKAEIHLFEKSECSRTLNRQISEIHICAGGEENQDACQGDSGGPLVATVEIPSEDGTSTEEFHYLAGIVSFGNA